MKQPTKPVFNSVTKSAVEKAGVTNDCTGVYCK